MALEVVTGTSRTTTTAMMQRRHYAIIRTTSARTIRSTGLLLHRHHHRHRQLQDTMGRRNSVQYVRALLGPTFVSQSECGMLVWVVLCMLGLLCNMPLLVFMWVCNHSTFATSISLVSFNPLRHARFSLRHAIVSFDVSVIVVHSLFHKLQFTYL